MKKRTNTTHGGSRSGAGRRPGRIAVTSSINLPPAIWAKLDRIRGTVSRSKFFLRKIESWKDPAE